ncbi:GntR family transcriptional regulator [Cryptosporangium sp. NPDC048952]|uniref:GntR family transcriptional regulator n=1 Tax=Cryptosporangium sp. NPDC048952 TaxID=3363961 RepID=UPI003712500F
MQADAAYARLREAIVDGQYPAGARLTEVEIAETLGMSRTPVREALRRLAGDGLVRASDRGVIVDLMDEEEAWHARTVRAALDVLVAELAARRQKAGEVSPAALRAAEEAAASAQTYLERGDTDEAYRHDQRLHRQIAEIAGNPVALQMLDRLADRLEVARLAAAARAERARGIEKKVESIHLVTKVPAVVGAAHFDGDVLSDVNGHAVNGANGSHGAGADKPGADGTPGSASTKKKGKRDDDGMGRLAVPVLSPDLAEEHRRLLDAIAAGQPAAAWLAAREHAHG